MREHKSSKEFYATAAQLSNNEYLREWVPPSLLLLVQTLVPDELKQISICHSIVQAEKPRSVIEPLLFGIGVECDHLFHSKLLVNLLARLGFSISYDEVTRYKQSVVQSNECDPRLQSFPSTFTQWVADNVDYNVSTLDGLGTFHGMGIIAISMPISRDCTRAREVAVTRLKRATIEDATRHSGITIQFYCPPTVPGLSSLTFKTRKCLQSPFVFPPSFNLDLLWTTGWLLPEETCSTPNWSGFMQHVCTGIHPPPADVIMLPIIDLNPSDDHCIYSTLRFVEQQAKHLGIETPCITFDQPLWLKAVEIITATKINIVCRLGGFHTMMSFIGSIGTVMAGSGLSDVLEMCYGPNTIQHMMSGKAFDRALRGHFLVDAALADELLKIIRCSCKPSSKGQCSSNLCTCRKNGLRCVSACGDCHGDACLNAKPAHVSNASEACNVEMNDEVEPKLVNEAAVFDEDTGNLQWQGQEEEVWCDM